MTTKDNILIYLKENEGNWVSGELLSSRLQISRAAISKQVRKLKEDGYRIETSTKKGYLLQDRSDLLLAQEIQEGLKTRIFGKKELICFKETDSTNIQAKILAAAHAPEGTMVAAETQTLGLGRKKRTWFAPAGDGIYASLILRPVIAPEQASRITLTAAVAVAEALISITRLAVQIKWPNDILINGKKAAGILTEISTEMDSIDHVIVGLGINVNTAKDTFPAELREKATSIFIETGQPFSRIAILKAYLEHFECYYNMLQKTGFAEISNRWKALSNVTGKYIAVQTIAKKYFGHMVDIDSDGALLLKDSRGKIHRIVSGDLSVK